MANTVNTNLAATPAAAGSTGGSWFEAMADAWGRSLDAQAKSIEDKSAAMDQGGDTPSDITQLTAMSLKMTFLANSSHTALSSVGSALETMARKQ
jgi:hypothetical protein